MLQKGMTIDKHTGKMRPLEQIENIKIEQVL